MKNRQVKRAEKKHVIGSNHNNNMANQNGLDEIDLWAEGVGQAESAKSAMTPVRKHVCMV